MPTPAKGVGPVRMAGVVLNEPMGPLAHLGLARAYAMHGETAEARAAYQDFFQPVEGC